MAAEQLKTDQALYVNWLIQRQLFDFDRLEIINATDQDVEQFAGRHYGKAIRLAYPAW